MEEGGVAYLEPRQTYNMQCFVEQKFTNFAKHFMLYICQSS